MPIVGLAAALLLGYLVGAVPSGVLVGRLRGVDPRAAGSGRTGATNALRTLGAPWAVAVAMLDLAKGVLAVVLGGPVCAFLGGDPAWGAALAGMASVLGHVWSVFIGFTGGRGVATGGGAMLVLAPFAVLAALPVMVAAVALTRYVSLGSILAAVTVALATGALLAVGLGSLPAVAAASVIAAVVLAAHADNIERLRAGTERRLGRD